MKKPAGFGISIVYLAITGSLLLLVCIAKASFLPLGHDESLTYSIFHWDPYRTQTANHHPLNSLWVNFASKYSRVSELEIRLGSVIGYFIFVLASGVSSLVLTGRIGATYFAALNCNIAVLEFSGVARGYCYALALLQLSITGTLLLASLKDLTRPRVYYFLYIGSVAAACASASAIYTFALAIPGSLIGATALLLTKTPKNPSRNIAVLTAIACAVSAIAVASTRLLDLNNRGELYIGGDGGIISGALNSLASYRIDIPDSTSSQLQHSLALVLMAILAAFSFVAAFGCMYRIYKAGLTVISRLDALALVCATTLATTSLGGIAAGTTPTGRTILYFVPILYIFGFEALKEVSSSQGSFKDLGFKRFRVATVSAVIIIAIWSSVSGTLDYYYSISYNSNFSKEAIRAISRDLESTGTRAHNTSIGAFWIWQPSLNFYIHSMGLREKGVNFVSRDRLTPSSNFGYLIDRGGDFIEENRSMVENGYEPIQTIVAGKRSRAIIYKSKS